MFRIWRAGRRSALGRQLYATADETDQARVQLLAALGFACQRRELVLRIPTDAANWNLSPAEPPRGIVIERADSVEEDWLRLLDDLLRQDVPGTDGWKWAPADFHEETYDTPDFNPATYLVAVDERGNGAGIVRVWMKPDLPRLGFIGVRSTGAEEVSGARSSRKPSTPSDNTVRLR